MTPLRSRLLLAALAACVLAPSASGAPAAAGDGRYQVRMTAVGKAVASAASLKRSDIGTASGWKGGPVKPDLSVDPGCPNYHPKHSDLVIVGAAAADFDHAGINFHSESQVLKTAKMARLDWQRSNAPGELACARANLMKLSTAATRIVSIERMAFPGIGERSGAFRILIDVTGASREIIRMATDIVFVVRGRTEITLLTTAPLSAMASLKVVEVDLAMKLFSRARA